MLTATNGTAVEVPTADVWARWPVLSPLLALTEPPYRFERLASGMVVGHRDYESYQDTIWFVEAPAGGIRRPIPNWTGPRIMPEATSGSVTDALELLLRPARVIES